MSLRKKLLQHIWIFAEFLTRNYRGQCKEKILKKTISFDWFRIVFDIWWKISQIIISVFVFRWKTSTGGGWPLLFRVGIFLMWNFVKKKQKLGIILMRSFNHWSTESGRRNSTWSTMMRKTLSSIILKIRLFFDRIWVALDWLAMKLSPCHMPVRKMFHFSLKFVMNYN